MWDTVHEIAASHLSHDMPCLACGHPAHRFLACDAECECRRSAMPGSTPVNAA